MRTQFLGALAFICLAISPLPAVPINLTSDADSYIRGGAGASTYYGSDIDIALKDSGGDGYTRKGYVRFDASSVYAPVTDAALRMEVGYNNSATAITVKVWGLNDGHAGETWGEGTINWNNAPANAAGNQFDLVQCAYLGQFSVPASTLGVYEFANADSASPNAMINFINGEIGDTGSERDGLVTFLLQRVSTNSGANFYFYSKEAAGAAMDPTLRLVPEPATLSLLALGGLGLLRSRRRSYGA